MKLSKKPETKSPRQEFHSSRSLDAQPQVTAYQHQDPVAYQTPLTAPTQASMDPSVPDSVPQANPDFSNLPPAAPLASTVSSITNTRRDPRMARHAAGVTVTYTPPEKPTNSMLEPLLAPPAAPAPAEVGSKMPLPMPPAPPPSVSMSKPAKARCTSHPHSCVPPPGLLILITGAPNTLNTMYVGCRAI